MQKIRTSKHPKFITRDHENNENGFLVPIFNIKENFFPIGEEPQQVYLTSVKPGTIKGPHLHFIRRGFFTCIKGNVRIILKSEGEYQEFFSGEEYEYLSVEIPTGVSAAVECIGDEESLILNMPFPSWDPEMNDEYTDDFSDFFQTEIK